jgi:ComEC/Rec2-related protein
MALLLLAVLRYVGVTQPFWFYWLTPLLTLYVMMTGLAPSAVRACLMAVVFWLAPMLQRRPDGLTALAWSAVLILAWDATQWRDIGFLLSYAAVLGLLLIYPPLAAHTHGWLRTDPWRLQEEPWWRRWSRATVRYSALLALTSMAVCLVTDPLTARYFNLLSPVALLANLAVIPAAGLMMTLGVLALLGGALWSPLADLFNSANLPVISFIMRCTEWSAALPGGHFYLRSPAWSWIAVYYLGLILLLIGNRRARQVVVTVGLLLAGAIVWRAATDQTMAVHVWRLGGATVALVEAPRGDRVLVNTGPRHVIRDLLRRLHAEGVGDLRALALTRGAREYAGGAGELLQQMQVRELWGTAGGMPAEVELYAARSQLNVRTLKAGLYVPLANNADLEVFHPTTETRSRRSADRAPIFRLRRGPMAVLFLNDAGSNALAPLRERLAQPPVAVVVADNAAALDPAWLVALGTRDVVTPASQVSEVQARQAAAQRSGVCLWRLEEEDALHVVWPAATNPPVRAVISQYPWRTTGPTAF